MRFHKFTSALIVLAVCFATVWGTWRIKHIDTTSFERKKELHKEWRKTRDGDRLTTNWETYTIKYSVTGFAQVKLDTVHTRSWYSWSNTNN